jgi:hypothetical protein
MANTESKALAVVRWLADNAIVGVPGMSSARALAQEYLDDPRHVDADARVKSLIARETTNNFATGFLTGFGGLVTLPVAVPAALGATWAIQGRMAAAIATLHGHDVDEDRVRTLVLLSLVGDAGKESLKRAGVRVGLKIAEKALQQIPGRVLAEVDKKMVMRWLARGSRGGLLGSTRLVPLVGALVGGTFDALACRAVGKVAHELFRSHEEVPSDAPVGPREHPAPQPDG